MEKPIEQNKNLGESIEDMTMDKNSYQRLVK